MTWTAEDFTQTLRQDLLPYRNVKADILSNAIAELN